MTDGTAFRETHSSTVQLKKPPLILSNKLALKKQRRRELLNAGAMLNQQIGAQDHYRQAGLFIDRSVPALNSRMQGGARMYDAPVTGIEEDEQLASLPYAIMPVEQPIMMVNYPSRAPIHLGAPQRIQQVRYNSYGDHSRDIMGGTGKFLVNADSGEELYYQLVDPNLASTSKPRRGAYDRSCNAVENWAWFTQRLADLERMKIQERLQGNKAAGYGEVIDYDVDDDQELVLYDEYDDESDVYRPRVMPKRGPNKSKARRDREAVLMRWRTLTQKLIKNKGADDGWQGVGRAVNGRVALREEMAKNGNDTRVVANWKKLLLGTVEAKQGLNLKLLGERDLLRKLTMKEEKLLRMEVYRRWNILIRKAFQRMESTRAQNNIERWSKLVKAAEGAGHLSLRSPFDANLPKLFDQ